MTDHVSEHRPAPAVLSRRKVLALGGGAFVLALAPRALRRRRLVTRQIPVMGTVAEVLVADEHTDLAQEAIDLALDRLRWVDAAMSRFRADSDIGRVNRAAWRDAIPVLPATAHVLREALGWAEASDGLYDPGLARLIEAWDVTHRTAPPARDAFARLAGRQLHRGVVIDARQDRPVVRFDSPDIGLDLGGIAKGYAVDAAMAAIASTGIRHAVVNAGGDLRAMGRSADGDWWRVGIRDPADPERIRGEIEVRDEAIATSGDYLQGFDFGGRRYHHILDPETGEPRRAAAHSLTVRAPTCMAADAGATAVFGLDPERARRILDASGTGAAIVA